MGERLRNGEFYAKDTKVFRAPIETKTEGGTSINIGFPVCTVSEYVSADNVAECLNASRHHEDLVKALQDLDAVLDFGDENLEPVWTFDDLTAVKAAFKSAREALAKAATS